MTSNDILNTCIKFNKQRITFVIIIDEKADIENAIY